MQYLILLMWFLSLNLISGLPEDTRPWNSFGVFSVLVISAETYVFSGILRNEYSTCALDLRTKLALHFSITFIESVLMVTCGLSRRENFHLPAEIEAVMFRAIRCLAFHFFSPVLSLTSWMLNRWYAGAIFSHFTGLYPKVTLVLNLSKLPNESFILISSSNCHEQCLPMPPPRETDRRERKSGDASSSMNEISSCA